MASLNTIVFYLLSVEVTAVLIMIAPMPSFIRGGIVRWIGTSSMLSAIQRPTMYFAVVVLAMWGATTRDAYKYADQYHEAKSSGADLPTKMQLEVQMFRAQRNFYLTGSCVLLLLVIYRVYVQLKELNRLEATSTALKKQADNAAGAYKSLSDELTDLKAKHKAVAASGKSGSDAAAADDGELVRLREQNTKLAAERTSAEKDVEALKRQAEGLNKEYARLLVEKEGLENKLQDFELLMGDAAKKNK